MNYLSMTAGDQAPGKPFAEITAKLFQSPPGDPNVPPPPKQASVDPVPYSTTAHFVHGPLCDLDTLLDKLVLDYDRIEQLIRPPFGRISELGRSGSARKFRDPRDPRDGRHDMRMPPFMRNSDLNPLSITVRQYVALLELMDLERKKREARSGSPLNRPSNRRVAEFQKRRGKRPKG